MAWRRVAACGLAVVAIAAGGAVAAGYTHHLGPSVPAASPVVSTASRASASIHAPERAIAERPILFLGASYTAGLGATGPAYSYPDLVGRALHRPVAIDAVSGSGFLNPGPRRQGTFAQRIARLPAGLDPGLVVIQGGRNDAYYPRRALLGAVDRTVTECRRRFRHADLAFLGPIPASLPVRHEVRVVESVLAEVARARGVLFVDALAQGWITPANVRAFQGPVRGHPNDAGYAYIAQRLTGDLEAGGLATVNHSAGPVAAPLELGRPNPSTPSTPSPPAPRPVPTELTSA